MEVPLDDPAADVPSVEGPGPVEDYLVEEGGLRVTLVKAVVKAAERARALATEQ